MGNDLVGRVGLPDRLQELAGFIAKNGEVIIQQAGRTEGHVVRKGQPSADRLDGLLLFDDLACEIVLDVGVLTSFDVDARLDLLECLDRGRPAVDRYVVDVAQRCDGLGPQTLVEYGTARALADIPVFGQRHDQHVAEFSRLLKVANMPRMHQVEGAVAMDDRFAVGLVPRDDLLEFVERHYFFGYLFGHAGLVPA